MSNYSEDQIDALADATGEMPVVNQIEWSPFGWSRKMLAYCRKNQIALQAYSPLTHGKRLDNEDVQEIAESHGKTQAQILIRWALQSGVSVIPKANRLEHLRENIDVFDFSLSDPQMHALDQLNEDWSALSTHPIYMEQ